MKKFTIFFFTALVVSTLGCASQKADPRVPLLEARMNDNNSRITELERVVGEHSVRSFVLQHQIDQLKDDYRNLRQRLCEKDTAFCNTYTVE